MASPSREPFRPPGADPEHWFRAPSSRCELCRAGLLAGCEGRGARPGASSAPPVQLFVRCRCRCGAAVRVRRSSRVAGSSHRSGGLRGSAQSMPTATIVSHCRCELAAIGRTPRQTDHSRRDRRKSYESSVVRMRHGRDTDGASRSRVGLRVDKYGGRPPRPPRICSTKSRTVQGIRVCGMCLAHPAVSPSASHFS